MAGGIFVSSAYGGPVTGSGYSVASVMDMTPRQQWNANFGYCGETSFIQAGMYYGQYTSQWTARNLATPGVPQTKHASQLLLNANDLKAAKKMKLNATSFDHRRSRTTQQYFEWVKAQVGRGYPVIIGVYDNKRALDEPLPGDPDYDHIAPVMAIDEKTITISDNGLYEDQLQRPYLFTYLRASFPKTRSQANQQGGAIYSLRATAPNFATAVTGVRDQSGVTAAVRLTANINGEGIQDQPKLKAPPPPLPVTLTATVAIADQSVAYRVYLYSDFARVPTKDFNAQAANAERSWTIPAGTGPKWTVSINTTTDQTKVFRAVPITAS